MCLFMTGDFDLLTYQTVVFGYVLTQMNQTCKRKEIASEVVMFIFNVQNLVNHFIENEDFIKIIRNIIFKHN